jgi:hypothetical protein
LGKKGRRNAGGLYCPQRNVIKESSLEANTYAVTDDDGEDYLYHTKEFETFFSCANLSKCPILNEVFTKDGEWSHWALIDQQSGVEIWNSLSGLSFDAVSRPLIKYLCENHHPHVTVIVTPAGAELLGGMKSTGKVEDYLVDKGIIWNGDASLANNIFGERFGVDWEYTEKGSNDIKVNGKVIKVGDPIGEIAVE